MTSPIKRAIVAELQRVGATDIARGHKRKHPCVAFVFQGKAQEFVFSGTPSSDAGPRMACAELRRRLGVTRPATKRRGTKRPLGQRERPPPLPDQITVKPDPFAVLVRLKQARPEAPNPTPHHGTTPQMTERTFAMIKPGAVAAGHAGAIMQHILDADFTIVRAQQTPISPAQATELYQVHETADYYARLMDSIVVPDQPAILLVLERVYAVEVWRSLIGPASIEDRRPGHLRRLYGDPDQKAENGLHGSDSVEAAAREIGLFFPQLLPPERFSNTTWTFTVRDDVASRHPPYLVGETDRALDSLALTLLKLGAVEVTRKSDIDGDDGVWRSYQLRISFISPAKQDPGVMDQVMGRKAPVQPPPPVEPDIATEPSSGPAAAEAYVSTLRSGPIPVGQEQGVPPVAPV